MVEKGSGFDFFGKILPNLDLCNLFLLFIWNYV